MAFFDAAGDIALGSRLRRLGDLLADDARAIYTHYDVPLDPRWFPVFYTLATHGEGTVTELATAIGQSHAAVSQVVRQLKDAGLVTTDRSTDDGRRTCIRLSKAGKRAAERLAVQCLDVEAAVADLIDSISPDLRIQLRELERELDHARLAQRVAAARKRRCSAAVTIEPFRRRHREAFKALNLAWIRAHWEPEPADFQALDHPQAAILNKGGYIAIAVRNGTAIGTCALLKLSDDEYELAKMSVAESEKGKGIGMLLGTAVIDEARRRGARRLYLESNTVLEPAINLYRKLGFSRTQQTPSPYARCNIQMELML